MQFGFACTFQPASQRSSLRALAQAAQPPSGQRKRCVVNGVLPQDLHVFALKSGLLDLLQTLIELLQFLQ